MPSGGKIKISDQANGESIQIVIEDTGPGISPSILPKLFQPFASTKPTGLGLGLVISRRIVEEHDGTLMAENLPGGGARFTILFPKKRGSA